MLRFFKELKRRNVVRVGIAYMVTGWLVIQVVEKRADVAVEDNVDAS